MKNKQGQYWLFDATMRWIETAVHEKINISALLTNDAALTVGGGGGGGGDAERMAVGGGDAASITVSCQWWVRENKFSKNYGKMTEQMEMWVDKTRLNAFLLVLEYAFELDAFYWKHSEVF